MATTTAFSKHPNRIAMFIILAMGMLPACTRRTSGRNPFPPGSVTWNKCKKIGGEPEGEKIFCDGGRINRGQITDALCPCICCGPPPLKESFEEFFYFVNAPNPPKFPPAIDKRFRVNPHTGRLRFSNRTSGEEYSAMNNSAQCDKTVREALEDVDGRRWGPFDYDCYQGRVIKILAPLDSPIAHNHIGFIKRNPVIFGLPNGHGIRLQAGDHGQQIFNGERAATGVSVEFKRNGGMFQDENYFRMYAFLVDTSTWTTRRP